MTVTLCETPLAVAVRTADVTDVTEEEVAVNVALVAFAGTTTDEGTLRLVLLLARPTVTLPGADAFNVTEQASVPAPVRDKDAQFIELKTPLAFSCSEKVAVALSADAVNVTFCAALTADTSAVKLTLVALAGTVTVAGTATAALFVARLTL